MTNQRPVCCSGGREREEGMDEDSGRSSVSLLISKMASKKHHASTIVKFLGPSADLPPADLPTLRDVLKQCQLLRERHVGPSYNYELSDMASDVLPLIIAIWNRANAKLSQPPVRVSDQALKDRIKAKWTILSKIAGKNGKVNAKERQRFTSDLDKLFNILVCSCSFTNCAEANAISKTVRPSISSAAVHVNPKFHNSIYRS